MRITNQPPLASTPDHESASAADIEADFWRELKEIEAEAIGWTALAPGCHVHAGSPDDNTVEIVGIPQAQMAGLNVVWLF